jgi:hypothetical protein
MWNEHSPKPQSKECVLAEGIVKRECVRVLKSDSKERRYVTTAGVKERQRESDGLESKHS